VCDIKRPNTIVRSIARAYAEAGPTEKPTFTANNDPELEALWTALNEPELLDEQVRAAILEWAAVWEGDYDAIAVGAREKFQAVNASPRDRPATAAGTLRGFMRNDDQVFSSLVAPIYGNNMLDSSAEGVTR
jgi:hypothetical protein